ncbi:MAG: SDR family oxidoreductase [Chloroflexi bacterium]|nr:SDR family oxidoreductase [Chloroflexota bacterium]
MDLQLKDKRAFVAGASRGLGYAVARGLAMEGCRVAINSRDAEKLTASARELEEAAGSTVIPVPGDVSVPAMPERIIRKAAEALGGLDILVTNAGGPPAGAFESFDEADWQQAVELSFMSHVRLIRAALPHLRQSEAASVLTVTSITVKQPIPNLILSNSVRAATVGLTKTLALELGGDGIRFNSILPGWTKTERVIELMSFRAESNGTTVEEEIAKQSLASPLGRMGQPEEFANAAVFLVSPAASYLTGVMLNVDGGMYKGTM